MQVNGKLRDRIEAPAEASKEELLALAKASEKVAKYLDGKEIVKEIVVPGKLVNLVVQVRARSSDRARPERQCLVETATCSSGASRNLPSRSGIASAPTSSWTRANSARATSP